MSNAIDRLDAPYATLLDRLRPHRPRSPFHHAIQRGPTGNGDPHVELVDGHLHYVVTERGREVERRIAADEDELLYWLFDSVTRSLSDAVREPWLSQLRGRDSRRHRFDTHVRLLERLDPAWAERTSRHYAEVLRRYPYRDG